MLTHGYTSARIRLESISQPGIRMPRPACNGDGTALASDSMQRVRSIPHCDNPVLCVVFVGEARLEMAASC